MALEEYMDREVLVLAIPRGGVEIGFEVARHLKASLHLLITRKLPFPNNPESGFGAISEDGSTYIHRQAASWLSAGEIERIKEEQSEEIKRRIKILRKGKPLPDISAKTVMLVDDGLAMGSTMLASINYCRHQKVAEVVVAVPVAGLRAASLVSRKADRLVVLEMPENFRAVAQVYQNWHDVTDSQVLSILDQWEKLKKSY